MKILKVALLLAIAATTITAQKEGNVIIRANVPVKVWITRDDQASGSILVVDDTAPVGESLSAGNYTVSFELPDGTTSSRIVTIKKNCITRFDVIYRPPTCPTCAPAETPVPNVITTPKPAEPEFTFKPEPVPTRFDECCGCSRDDLKARLDLFAIQLHQNPTVRGRVIARNDVAILYLVNQRGVDRARLELQTAATNCVELWILP